jgi:N-acetylneuraminate synthase
VKVFVIAEAGVNHNGSLELACQLVDAAAAAGADAVKFQTFKATALVSRNAPKAAYQLRTTDREESQFEMIHRLELPIDHHRILIDHATSQGLEFLSTPFDSDSLDLLVYKFNLETIKLPSGEITNGPLLLQLARSGRRVILSTGMSNLGEVESALAVLAFGYVAENGVLPSHTAFETAYLSSEGRQALRERVTLLHCTTEYPTNPGEVNLRAMDTLSYAFGLPVGYSDHTEGIHIPVAAVARGAVLIEKHFTLDRNLPGPDQKASLEPLELAAMVKAIRDIERALGDGIKRPMPPELQNRDVVRKSLVSIKPITKGELFSPDNLGCKRPGTGLSPMEYWGHLGRHSTRNYVADESIED